MNGKPETIMCELYCSLQMTILKKKKKDIHCSGNAHFRRSNQVIEWLKFPKTDCSSPHQDFGPTVIQIWWSHIPLFLQYCGQACYCFPTKLKPMVSSKQRYADKCTPLFLQCCGQACYHFPTKFKLKISSKHRHADKCIPLFLRCFEQACKCFPTKFKPQVSSKHRHADKSIRIAGAPCFGWS